VTWRVGTAAWRTVGDAAAEWVQRSGEEERTSGASEWVQGSRDGWEWVRESERRVTDKALRCVAVDRVVRGPSGWDGRPHSIVVVIIKARI